MAWQMDGIFDVLHSMYLYSDLKLNVIGYAYQEIDISTHNHETDSSTGKREVKILGKSEKASL